jgi:hypothetical protein
MTNILTEIEDEAETLYDDAKSAVSPAITVAKADLSAAGSATASYIKTNVLDDAYQIAVSVVGGAVVGQPWTTTLATIVTEVKAAGKTIVAGAEAILGAQAQADLIAAGKLLPPVSSTTA